MGKMPLTVGRGGNARLEANHSQAGKKWKGGGVKSNERLRRSGGQNKVSSKLREEDGNAGKKEEWVLHQKFAQRDQQPKGRRGRRCKSGRTVREARGRGGGKISADKERKKRRR